MVIGVGNEFRGDDGAGLVVIDLLGQWLGDRVRLVKSDGEPASLIDAWRDADLAIVVDAVACDPATPGRTHLLELEAGDEAGLRRAVSSHGLGIGTAISLGRVLRLLPGKLIVRAIEVADVNFGGGLNSPVKAAAELTASAILGDLGIGQVAG